MDENPVLNYYRHEPPPKKVIQDPVVLIKLRRRMFVTWLWFIPLCLFIFLLWINSDAVGVGVWPGLHLESDGDHVCVEAIRSHHAWRAGFYGASKSTVHPWKEHVFPPTLDLTLLGFGIYAGTCPVCCYHPDPGWSSWTYEKVCGFYFPHWVIVLLAGIILFRRFMILRRLTRRLRRRRELWRAPPRIAVSKFRRENHLDPTRTLLSKCEQGRFR